MEVQFLDKSMLVEIASRRGIVVSFVQYRREDNKRPEITRTGQAHYAPSSPFVFRATKDRLAGGITARDASPTCHVRRMLMRKKVWREGYEGFAR